MQTHNNMQGDDLRSVLAKYRWPALVAMLAVAIVYMICKPLGQSDQSDLPTTKDLVYEPIGGAWVNDSLGNGDGQLNPGEQVKVFPRLTNNGKQPIPAFDLVLSTTETRVNLRDIRCHYPAIEPGQSVLPDDPFEFKLDTLFFSDCVLFLGKVAKPAQAGLVSDAFGAINEQEISIILQATSNYRVCLTEAQLIEVRQAPGSQNWEYILSIDLRLCNASSKLSKPFLKINPATIDLCDSPAMNFTVREETDNTGATRAFDQLFYTSDLSSMGCQVPDTPKLALAIGANAKFRFNTVMARLNLDARKCIYFSVEINKREMVPSGEDEEQLIEKTTLVARAFVGGEAKVALPLIGITSLNNRRLR